MKFKNLSVVVFGLAVMLSACSAKKQELPKGRPAALVVVASSSQQNVPIQLKAIGTMEASESIAIRTQISGELTMVAFREGQDVQKGALLFQLDPRNYQAAVRKAEANLARDRVITANARKDYERYSQLVKEGIVTHEQAEGYRTKADSAAADVAADQAAVDSAREMLNYCTIKAPISGRLGVLAVDRGNVVKANETVLVTINKLVPINATFTIPEKDFPEVQRHMAAGRIAIEAEVPGNSGVREQGTITFIDNSVDSATGTIRLKASFENRRKQLWPGQFVNLSMILAMRNNAVVVPSQAVQTGQKGQFVFVVKPDATAELRPVETGPVSQGMTVIEKGLRSGEQVVVDGQMRVVPGGKVQVVKAGTGDQGPGSGKAATEGTGSGRK
ncbi:efflux RND transporter periplasmic adaptor subunit [Pelotalea chapellei]|uniref:Efflux RND transporter periplasmic adaptor subunit n=1 Tax=Pelotalea chapellei TaxID=44671 RepID=A0ABS5U5P8_9BACT|nr:efflux RND transporter periplasmic adaptor subunit [Pelotalea chapellei]MBT1070986.1 efflux RND transporter periplasmic adaptor subunit [Pelotalea chapellei]